MLMTDGEPRIIPKEGHQKALNNYINQHNFHPTINTYAFGKKIDSPLLKDIAMIGNGSYIFIPCPGFVGTIFVNSISNILSSLGSECIIDVKTLNGVKLSKILGGHRSEIVAENIKIHCGNLSFGQFSSIVLQLEFPKNFDKKESAILDANLSYYDYRGQKTIRGKVENLVYPPYVDPMIEADICRLTAVDKIQQAWGRAMASLSNLPESQKIIKDTIGEFEKILKELDSKIGDWEDEDDQYRMDKGQKALKLIQGYIEDLEKEVSLGFAKDYSFNHWGKHFFLSLSFAHLRQQCNNFCDPGVQNYGGKLFNELKDIMANSFQTIKPPPPSKKSVPGGLNDDDIAIFKQFGQNPVQQQQQQQQQPDPDPVDMADYNAGGGCFSGDCTTVLADNSEILLKNLKKGDVILSPDGSKTAVLATVKIECKKGKTLLCELQNGLLITPKHPVKIDRKWQKPFSLADIQLTQCDFVYNFILESRGIMEVNGVQCATLGHGLKEENVQHEYFGEKIVQDLAKFDTFEKGFVQLKMDQFVRHENTNSVCGIIF